MVQHDKIQTSSLRSELTKYDLEPGYFCKFLKDQIVRKFILEHNVNSILDLGCDTCYAHQLLTHRGWNGKYTGVDYRESYHPQYLGAGQFIETQSIINTIPTLGTFDTILMLDVIEHMDNKEMGYDLLNAASLALNDNGYIILTTPNSIDGVQLQWPKYHVYEYNYQEILNHLPKDLVVKSFVGWSAKNDTFEADEKYYDTVVPQEIRRALWALDNPAQACDIMIILQKEIQL